MPRTDVTNHQTRVTTDGGTVADIDFLDGLIQLIDDEGVLSNLIFLADPNCGHKLNAGAVEKLYDFSSNNNDPAQSSAAFRPTLDTSSVAEKPMLLFDGTDDLLELTSISVLANAATIIATSVAEEGSTDTNDWVIGTKGSYDAGIRIGGSASRVRIDGTNQDLNHADIAQDEIHSVCLRSGSSNSWTFYFNAETNTFTETGSFDFDAIGCRNINTDTEYFDGHISTIIAFDADISESSANLIRDYIKNYYTGGYRYEALGHRKRVVDGGGTVEDIAFLSDLFQELDDEGILSGLVGGWGAALGMDVDGSGDAEQLYDITTNANDAPFTSNRSRISTPTGATQQMLDRNGLAASFALGSLESFSGAFSLVFGAILDGSGTEGYILGHSSSNSDGIQYESDRIRFRLGSNNDLTIDVADRPSSNTFQVGAVTRDASNNGRSYWDATYVDGPNTISGTFDLGRIGGRSESLYNSFHSIHLAFDIELSASNVAALRAFINGYYTTVPSVPVEVQSSAKSGSVASSSVTVVPSSGVDVNSAASSGSQASSSLSVEKNVVSKALSGSKASSSVSIGLKVNSSAYSGSSASSVVTIESPTEITVQSKAYSGSTARSSLKIEIPVSTSASSGSVASSVVTVIPQGEVQVNSKASSGSSAQSSVTREIKPSSKASSGSVASSQVTVETPGELQVSSSASSGSSAGSFVSVDRNVRSGASSGSSASSVVTIDAPSEHLVESRAYSGSTAQSLPRVPVVHVVSSKAYSGSTAKSSFQDGLLVICSKVGGYPKTEVSFGGQEKTSFKAGGIYCLEIGE